jgi:hypothetical protein
MYFSGENPIIDSITVKDLMATLFLLLSLTMTPSDTLSQSALEKLLPTSLLEWKPAEPARFYTGREIFRYMDGAGEVYLAYGFKRLLVQRYARPNQEELLVEIFDMGLARNAFGAFTNMQGRGPAVGIGQGGEYKSGLLSFWRGRFFVCVMVEKETDEASRTVLELGRAISDAISEDGPVPALLRFLPQGLYMAESLRYLFRHEILNIHFYLADGNILCLNEKTDAVLVRMKSDKSYLLLIEYPEPREAEAAYDEFSKKYMPEAQGKGAIQTENKKWTVCMKQRQYLAVVFDAETQSQAQDLLDTLRRTLR